MKAQFSFHEKEACRPSYKDKDTKFLEALCFVDDVFCCSLNSSSRMQIHIIGNNFPPICAQEREKFTNIPESNMALAGNLFF